jgi:hypothetical protein
MRERKTVTFDSAGALIDRGFNWHDGSTDCCIVLSLQMGHRIAQHRPEMLNLVLLSEGKLKHKNFTSHQRVAWKR